MDKRAAIYVRVSTDKQTIENQLRELRQMVKAEVTALIFDVCFTPDIGHSFDSSALLLRPLGDIPHAVATFSTRPGSG
jgi:Resolvase, N terminal domain